MQALSDDQHIAAIDAKVDRLEEKVEVGFAETRAEARSDFRTLIAVNITILVAVIFGFAGLTVAMLTHF
ncbi:MAG TPA: hypothetical protein VN522_06125 [Solirubrobacterales bacterium]|nr:hypothetical protein [Solirubrobacterales bacterium]